MRTSSMRVLFACQPGKSIFQYLAPLAWALRTAGHEVHVASQPGFAPVINQAGLVAVPVGRDLDAWRLTDWRPQVRAAVQSVPLGPYDLSESRTGVTWAELTAGYATAVAWWHRLDNVPVVADLVAYARWWRPDLVIWEPTLFAGAIAARSCGAAHARMLFGFDVFGATRELYLGMRARQPAGDRADPLAEWLTGYAERYGTDFSESLITGQFTIDQFPASLAADTGLDHLRTRYVPYGGAAVVPAWLRTPPARPRIALTLGLSATERFDGYLIRLPELLDALSDLDVEVVATVADAHRPAPAAIPANARLIPYVPLHALAPTCVAAIHHAGAATMATVSLSGLPQLAVHQHFDQPALARRLARQGAGLAMGADEATAGTIRDAVLRLLGEPAFRLAAGRLRAEMLDAPSPGELVPQLEQRARNHR